MRHWCHRLAALACGPALLPLIRRLTRRHPGPGRPRTRLTSRFGASESAASGRGAGRKRKEAKSYKRRSEGAPQDSISSRKSAAYRGDRPPLRGLEEQDTERLGSGRVVQSQENSGLAASVAIRLSLLLFFSWRKTVPPSWWLFLL